MTEFLAAVNLSRGRHAGPDDGACLMELASLLAGERWSDHPAFVHPVLAVVARGVNDRVGDDSRARLAPLVPAMIGTATHDLGSCARLVLLCTGAALAPLHATSHADISCDLESAQRMARAVLSRTGPVHDGCSRGRGPRGETSAHLETCVTCTASGGPGSGGNGWWLTRFTVAVLDRARLLRRVYPRMAAAQAAVAVAAMEGAASGSEAAMCELLVSCVAECRTEPGTVGTPALRLVQLAGVRPHR